MAAPEGPTPLFPHVVVELLGDDGNAFAILGKVSSALETGGATRAERDEYMKLAMGGDYDNLLRVTMGYVEVV